MLSLLVPLCVLSGPSHLINPLQAKDLSTKNTKEHEDAFSLSASLCACRIGRKIDDFVQERFRQSNHRAVCPKCAEHCSEGVEYGRCDLAGEVCGRHLQRLLLRLLPRADVACFVVRAEWVKS